MHALYINTPNTPWSVAYPRMFFQNFFQRSGKVLGVLSPGVKLLPVLGSGLIWASRLLETPHTKGFEMVGSASLSQSSSVLGTLYVLTGTCHLRLCSEPPKFISTELLLTQLAIWWAISCFGIRWRALNGQVFNSLASLGWFFLHFRRWYGNRQARIWWLGSYGHCSNLFGSISSSVENEDQNKH